ncbi:MAG: 30S ribosomal protein S16 [Candidatus Margulisbacteria bacterium]|nr:30S ribosomal protein S16 [Candidatus Margulisiibacteriota bacterium]
MKLQRKGTKNKPFYRVVIQDESAARDSSVIEILGTYNPLQNPALFQVDEQKTKDWLAKGATPTDKVRILLGKAGVMEPIDLASLPKRKSKQEALGGKDKEKEEEKVAEAGENKEASQ